MDKHWNRTSAPLQFFLIIFTKKIIKISLSFIFLRVVLFSAIKQVNMTLEYFFKLDITCITKAGLSIALKVCRLRH